MESTSAAVAPKKAPRVSWAGGSVVTPKLLPAAAGVVVQPVKSPVSKSPLIMRLSAEVDRAVATRRRPMERTNVAMYLSGVSGFMVLPFLFPAELVFEFAGPEETKNLAGKMSSA